MLNNVYFDDHLKQTDNKNHENVYKNDDNNDDNLYDAGDHERNDEDDQWIDLMTNVTNDDEKNTIKIFKFNSYFEF